MELFRSLLDRSQTAWTAMSFNQRAILGIVVGAGVLSLVLFSVWLQSDSMVVLYSNLPPEEAAVAMDYLTRQGVKVEVQGGGTTILVPAQDVDRLRMAMILEGIGGDGLRGWDLFDEKVMGETEFGLNVRLKRAIEGELARSVASIDHVRSARVHITMPKQSVFARDRRPPTASVLMNLKGRGLPSQEQIQGVQYLVSSAVEGMEPDRVTVIDSASGRVLSQENQDGSIGLSSAQFRVRQEVENHLTSKANDILRDVLGPGRYVVRVNADLDFEQLERTTEDFDPQTVVRSEQTDESTDPAGTGSTYSITNYEVPKTVETVLRSGSILQKLSVAVAVDGSHSDPDGDGTTNYTPRSAEELAQIQRMVSGAIGIDASRGDTIEVVNMPFDVAEPPVANLLDNPWLQNAPEMVGKLLLFLVAAGLVLSLRKSFSGLLGEASGGTATASAGGGSVGPGVVDAVSGAATRRAGLPPEPTVDEEVATLEDWTRSQPDEVANLIKSFAMSEQS